jgi:DNA-binding XRE family transcriptional regulator
MKSEKKTRLQNAGWTVGTAEDFLGLTADEAALVELKLNLAKWLKAQRLAHKWTQVELAKRVGSSQSRMARVEAGDPSVSLDLMFRAAFAAGATQKDLAKVVGAPRSRRR